MDAQAIAQWVQAGGLVALAVIMTVLHVHDIRHTFPDSQEHFHQELQRERQIWAEELATVRENTERRQREMITAIHAAAERIERAIQESRRV